MSSANGANRITYVFTVKDENQEVVLQDSRTYDPLAYADPTIWGYQRTIDEIQLMMEKYLEEVNETFPTSAGYTLNTNRTYDTIGNLDEGWPPAV